METRGKAQGLFPAVCGFTFLCYVYFWSDVLEEIDLAQQYLQTKGVPLDKVVTLDKGVALDKGVTLGKGVTLDKGVTLG